MKPRKGKKKWTKKQIEYAISEVESAIHYKERVISEAQEEIEKNTILRKALRDMLATYYKNPSSRTYDQNAPGTS